MAKVKELLPSKFKNPKAYYIHDNGGRPFKVVVSKKSVDIYKIENNDNWDTPANFPKLTKSLGSYKGIFIGNDNKCGGRTKSRLSCK
jgi:hypothetical protein